MNSIEQRLQTHKDECNFQIDRIKESVLNGQIAPFPYSKINFESQHLLEVYNSYKDISDRIIYTDPKVKEEIDDLFSGKPDFTKWFVSLQSLNEQFNLIEQKNIFIDKELAVCLIHDHLLMRSLVSITEGREQASNAITNYRRRLIDYDKNERDHKKTTDKKFENLFTSFKEDIDVLGGVKFVQKLLKNDTDELLHILWASFHYDTKRMTQNEYYRALYPLCEILYRDRKFYNQGQFDDLQGKYYHTYLTHQSSVVKNLMKRK